MIETVAFIYTESLGPGFRNIYLIGAFFVLYSSLFASLAAWTRIYSDIFGQVGWINFYDDKQRGRVIAVLAWIFPIIWASLYLFIELPVMMILSGGLVGSILLFLIVFAAINESQVFPAAISRGNGCPFATFPPPSVPQNIVDERCANEATWNGNPYV